MWTLMVLGVVLCIAFWVLVIGGVAWLVVRLTGSSRRSGAANVLDERFARGEIDRDAYIERRGQLSGERA